jgi:hypothetical protein
VAEDNNARVREPDAHPFPPPGGEPSVVNHSDKDSAELHLGVIGRAPLAHVERIAVPHHDRHGGQRLQLVQQGRVDDVTGMQDVVGRFEERPRAEGKGARHPARVRVGENGDLHRRDGTRRPRPTR